MISVSGIRELLIDQIDGRRSSVGIVAGLVDASGRRLVAFGKLNSSDDRIPDGNSIFEIGSATKVFTALLLADMAERGEVALDDPAAHFLPSAVKMPMRDGRHITLLDLATHTSGLPRLPSNLKPADSENPYAEYSVQKLYDFLSGVKLTRNIGSQYEYSNLGGGLLGHILSLRAGMDYESLVRKRICEPLRLNSTVITLTKEMKARLATGHNADLQPVPLWDLPALAGAGALRSTANDLLIFLAANLGYLESPLAPAMAKMLTERRSTGNPNCMAAIGWHILARSGGEIAWHNGGTGGFRSFIGYDRPRGLGVVVLSNSRTAAGVDDVALQLLEWR